MYVADSPAYACDLFKTKENRLGFAEVFESDRDICDLAVDFAVVCFPDFEGGDLRVLRIIKRIKVYCGIAMCVSRDSLFPDQVGEFLCKIFVQKGAVLVLIKRVGLLIFV